MNTVTLVIAITLVIIALIVATAFVVDGYYYKKQGIELARLKQEQIIATKTLEESGALQKIQILRGFHIDFNRYAKKHNIPPVKDNKYSEDYLEKREVFQAGAEAYREAVLYILTSKEKGNDE